MSKLLGYLLALTMTFTPISSKAVDGKLYVDYELNELSLKNWMLVAASLSR
jgi:hypothetical protein